MATVVALNKRTLVKSCDASVAIGDLVYQDKLNVATVIKATSNNISTPVIGVVKSKPTSTTCKILIDGKHKHVIGQGTVFLSETGTFRIGLPATGKYQRLGFSCGNGTIWLQPDKTLVTGC